MRRQLHLDSFGIGSSDFVPTGTVAQLIERDAVFEAIVKRVGPYNLKTTKSPWATLVAAIVYQQISGTAAERILLRIKLEMPHAVVSPRVVLANPPGILRSLGVPKHKESALRFLAQAVENEEIDFNRLKSLDDEAAIELLSRIPGIGRWTSQMFLVFHLGRPNVLLSSDLGLRRAVQRAYGLKDAPSARELEAIASRWAPARTVASWYLWKSLPGFPEPGFPVDDTGPV